MKDICVTLGYLLEQLTRVPSGRRYMGCNNGSCYRPLPSVAPISSLLHLQFIPSGSQKRGSEHSSFIVSDARRSIFIPVDPLTTSIASLKFSHAYDGTLTQTLRTAIESVPYSFDRRALLELNDD